jgi:hypothetical protein
MLKSSSTASEEVAPLILDRRSSGINLPMVLFLFVVTDISN